jgi:outer membrane protein OmpA-like peptidoglycan-associated protein
MTIMNAKLLTGLGLALALGACASMPQPNAALENARAAVQTAEADPNVQRYSALDLEAAKKDLAIADDANVHHKDAEVNQPAYLALQNARLAQARAAAARTREANNAKLAAANANQAKDAALNERDAANQEAARAQAELEQLKATPTPRGSVMTLGDVLFDTGRAELKPGAARKLDQLVQFLMEHPERRVQIDGFTDSVGSDSYNEELSRRRADSVKAALLSRGVDASRVSTEGYGKAYPVANNGDSGGRQLNRRVEVVIGNSSQPIAPRSGS